MQNAIVSGNHADNGGGIANVLESPATIQSSTISGNSAAAAGGIFSTGGFSLLNVTVSGNSAPDFWGGGMDLYFTNTLRNVTIANNSSPLGRRHHGLRRIADADEHDHREQHAEQLLLQRFRSQAGSSHNLDTDNTCGLTGTGDKPGQNPLLGPLQNNGGPTPTHALGFGSPAVDAGINAAAPPDDSDQRGIYRPEDGDADGSATTDIGAYEASYPPPTILSIVPDGGAAAGGETVTITGTYLLTAALTIGGNGVTEIVTATTVTFTTPPHAPGPVNVNIETVGGAVSAAGGYTYFPLSAPAAFSATATGTQVSLSWSAVSGATGYEIWRSSLGGAYALLSSPTGTAATDPGLAADTTYLYRVRAMTDATPASAFATDAATTIDFTDAALSGAPIRAVHVAELRTAVNAMRAAAGLGAFGFTNPTLVAGATTIARLHLTELRTALDAARAAAGLPPITYTDPVITANSTQVKAVHMMEVRAGTQ